MSSPLQVTVLGCGNSTGVPSIGNHWGACDPLEQKNQRTRSSIMVEQGGKRLVIDTGPDFRNQLNRENISAIDGILYTHQHSDHVAGIDDLRVLKHRMDKPLIPCAMNKTTFSDLSQRFDYLFDGGNHELYPKIIEPHVFKPEDYGRPQSFCGIGFTPFEQDHGTCMSVGYRFGDFAYSVDMHTLGEAAIKTLKGVKIWLVDAAAYNQSSNPVHANLKTIYALNEQIGAKQVYLTSLSLAMDYQTMLRELPLGYAPAYDGMRVRIDANK